MKIRTERKALADTLAWVHQAIGKRHNVAALSGIRITARDGILTMQGFDYDVSHTATLSADVITEGECLAPAAFLVTFVGQMRGETVELVVNGDSLTITAGRSTYRTRTLRLEDYPSLPEQAPLVGTIDADSLADAVSTCRKAAESENSTTPVLSGIRMTGTSEGLRLVSTNRFVAMDRHLDWNHEADFTALPVARMVDDAVKGLVGEVRIGAREGLLSLSAAGRAVTMRQLDGEYPPLDRVLAALEPPALTVTVEGVDLAQAVARAGKLSDDETPVILDITSTSINLSIAATERGDGAEEVDCEATGEGQVKFSPRYLTDGLASMPPGPVTLGVREGIKATTVLPIDDNGSRLTIVMPKRGTK